MRSVCAISLAVILVVVCHGQDGLAQASDEWAGVRAADVAQLSPEWGPPVYLEVSRLGWSESLHVSDDGETVYFFHYPGPDLFTLRMQGGPYEDDGDILLSRREPDGQFRTQRKVTKYFLSEDLYTAAGISVDASGNLWYSSNREGRAGGWTPGDYDNENIYMNGVLLALNRTDENPGNPHYCAARDELWFDCNADTDICVVKNAAANSFAGCPEKAPYPINSKYARTASEREKFSGAFDAQPWLSPDCDTIYFTSNRDRVGQELDGPWIYRSRRLDADQWSEPEVVIRSWIGVGDVSLTADGRKIFFVQFLMNEKVEFSTGCSTRSGGVRGGNLLLGSARVRQAWGWVRSPVRVGNEVPDDWSASARLDVAPRRHVDGY